MWQCCYFLYDVTATSRNSMVHLRNSKGSYYWRHESILIEARVVQYLHHEYHIPYNTTIIYDNYLQQCRWCQHELAMKLYLQCTPETTKRPECDSWCDSDRWCDSECNRPFYRGPVFQLYNITSPALLHNSLNKNVNHLLLGSFTTSPVYSDVMAVLKPSECHLEYM